QRELLTHDDRDDRAENAHRQDGAYETSRPVEEVADVRARNHHPFGEHGQEDADSEHDSDECLDAHGEPLLERLACVPLLQCLLYAPPPARRTLMRRTAVRTVAWIRSAPDPLLTCRQPHDACRRRCSTCRSHPRSAPANADP